MFLIFFEKKLYLKNFFYFRIDLNWSTDLAYYPKLSKKLFILTPKTPTYV